MEITAAQFVSVAAAPGLVVVASSFERRWGPGAAGLVAAAPVTVLVGVVIVSADLGADTGRALALSTSAHVLAQVLTALALIGASRRTGSLVGLCLAVGTYVAAAGLIAFLDVRLAVALGALATLAGRYVLGGGAPMGQGSARTVPAAVVLAVRAGVALVAAVAITLASAWFGPQVGGAVGAFPVLSVTLALLVGRSGGPHDLRDVLRGTVRGLPAYLAFGVAYWAAQPMLGAAGGLVVAVATCCLVYCSVSRLVGPSTSPDDGPGGERGAVPVEGTTPARR